MHKQLLAMCDTHCSVARMSFFSINFKAPYNDTLQGMLLPHLVFSSIYHNYKNAWGKVMLPSPERLGEFWKLQTKHPSYKNHPSLRGNPQFAQRMIPLSLHGDGTPVVGVGKIWSRQLTIFSFNSHLGLGSAKDMQLHIWSFFDETQSERTLPEFFRILAWSLKWLQLGKHPDENHLGQKYPASTQEGRLANTDLADGYCGILWSLVGDLEYMYKVLQLPHYGNKSNPCALCRCTGGAEDVSWKDCRLTAPWLQTLWAPSQFLWWHLTFFLNHMSNM